MSMVRDQDGNWESVFKAMLEIMEPKYVAPQEEIADFPGASKDTVLRYCPSKKIYNVDLKSTDEFDNVKKLVTEVYDDFFKDYNKAVIIGDSRPEVTTVGLKVTGEYANYINFLWHVAHKLGYVKDLSKVQGQFPVLSCGTKTQGKQSNMWCLCCGLQLASLEQVQEHINVRTASFFVKFLTKGCLACNIKYDVEPNYENLASASHLFSHNHSTVMNAVLLGEAAYSVGDGRLNVGYPMPHALMARILTTLSIRSAPVGVLDNIYEMTQHNYNQTSYMQMSMQAEVQTGHFHATYGYWIPQESDTAFTFMPVHYLDAFRQFTIFRIDGRRVYSADNLRRYSFIPFIQDIIKRIEGKKLGACKVFRNSFNEDHFADDDKKRDHTKLSMRTMIFKNNVTETKNTGAFYTSSAPADGWDDMLDLLAELSSITEVEHVYTFTLLQQESQPSTEVVADIPLVETEVQKPSVFVDSLEAQLQLFADAEENRKDGKLTKKKGAYYEGERARTLIPYKALLPLYRMFYRTKKSAEQFIHENERLIQPKVNNRKIVYNNGSNWMYRHNFHTNIISIAQAV